MFSLGLALICFILYAIWHARDRRMLRNGVVLVAGVWLTVTGVAELLAEVFPPFGYVWFAAVALIPLAVLVLAGFLVANGLTMLRKEGRRLGNLLSLLVGLAMFALPVVAVILLATNSPIAVGLTAILFVLFGYVALVFVVFLAYAWAYGRHQYDDAPAAIIVLGSRLINGTPPPLLKSRLDKALELYWASEPRPLLIPSGGQGPDEERPEGAAMADYLVEAGAAADDVVPENQARTTEENLRYSLAIQTEAGRSGPAVAVTNNFHVLRAALLARKLKIPAEVVGSPTAAYYVPSAFLREFVAVFLQHKWLHVVLMLPFIALITVLTIGLQISYL